MLSRKMIEDFKFEMMQTVKEYTKNRAPINLLIVEDDIEISKFTEAKLSHFDEIKSIFCSYTYQEAILFLQKQTPTHVILDLNLPDGNGVDILKYIKKHLKEVIVYVFSINSELKPICLRLGANGFFDKNDENEKLIQAIIGN